MTTARPNTVEERHVKKSIIRQGGSNLGAYYQDEQLDIRDKAEELVLWHLHGAFERVLVERLAART